MSPPRRPSPVPSHRRGEAEEPREASPARRAAMHMLSSLHRPTGPTMDDVLEDLRKRGEVSPRDGALAMELARGVARQRAWLESVLARYLHYPLPGAAFHVKEALLLGIYQHVFLDRIPAHSIVDETVRLIAAFRTEATYRSLANALMRRVVETDRATLLPTEETHWMVRQSVPNWLASEVGQVLPSAELQPFFVASNQPAPLQLRVRATADGLTREEVAARIKGEVVDALHAVPDVEPHPLLPDCLTVVARGLAPDLLPSFRRGLFTVEDAGAQIAGALAGARPGMAILDLCASPGGKTAHLLDDAQRTAARLVAGDVNGEKVQRLRETLQRLDLAPLADLVISTRIRPEDYPGGFDLVVVDAPCTALGTLRRHPEVRWRRTPRDIRTVARTQVEILRTAAAFVKPGGVLVYSVCSFTQLETDQVLARFHREEPGFVPDPAPEGLPFDETALRAGKGRWRTYPHRDGCDAFFVARLRRRMEVAVATPPPVVEGE